MRRVYILHMKDPRTRKHDWIAYDGVNRVMRSSYKKLLQAWVDEHGMFAKATKFKGIMRPSEAACTMADIKMEVEEREKEGNES